MTDYTDTNDTVAIESDERSMPIVGQLVVLGLILFLVLGSSIIPKLTKPIDEDVDIPVPQASLPAAVPEEATDNFSTINIQGTAAYVWDVKQQRALYQKSSDTQLPLASITKLMTALVAYELIENTAKVPIDGAALSQEGDSGFKDGDRFLLKDILDLTLLSSSNDGAFAVANVVGSQLIPHGGARTFVEAMNVKAADLGLTQTYFKNPTGLDISTSEAGAYGSARDIVFLMEHIIKYYPELLTETANSASAIKSLTGEIHKAENTNPITDQITGLIGSKTGYTTLAGGNLVVAFNAGLNHPIIVVVLGSSYNGRFSDVKLLADAALKTIATEI